MPPRHLHRYRAVSNATSVIGRHPVELIVLVYDRIGDHLAEAVRALEQQQPEEVGLALKSVLDLLSQGLVQALDFERGGEIAVNLGRIYDFCLQRVLLAQTRKDAGMLREVAQILADLRLAAY